MNVHLPSDLQRLAPFIAVAVLAVAGLALVVRGVGGGGGGSGAERVIERAFGEEGKVRSGKFNVTAGLSLQGAQQQAGDVGLKAAGAFDQVGPKFDLDLSATGGGEETSLRALSDGKQGFLRFGGRWYTVPKEQFERLGERQAGAGQSPLSALGVDPRSWLRNPTDQGTAQVGGEATDHVSADVDTAKMVSDFQGLAERTGQAADIPPQMRETIEDAVKQARVDVYVGQADGALRRLVVTAQLDAAVVPGVPPMQGQLRFDVQISDVNRPQRFRAPRGAAPVSDLSDVPGLGDLGALGGSGAGSGAGGGGAGSPEGGKSRERSRSGQAYVNCVQQAQDAAALEKCQALVP
jgi:hypothetical protein